MGDLRAVSLELPAALALLGSLNDECQQIVGGDGIGGQEVVEAITQCRFHQAGGLRAGQLLLGLSLEMWFTNEDRRRLAASGVRTSSATMAVARLLARCSPQARSPFSRAARNPASCVPPNEVGTVLQ